MEISSISPTSSTPALTNTPDLVVKENPVTKPQPATEPQNVSPDLPSSSGNIAEVQDTITGDMNDKESLRLAMVNEGARNYIADAFVVSDTTFTIIKDPYSGEYITRFRSLRDGKVTYIPEQEVLNYSPYRHGLPNLEETYA